MDEKDKKIRAKAKGVVKVGESFELSAELSSDGHAPNSFAIILIALSIIILLISLYISFFS